MGQSLSKLPPVNTNNPFNSSYPKMSCLRVSLLLTNILLGLLGILLLAGGIWLTVDESSAAELLQQINNTELVDTIREVPRLEGTLEEVTTHPYFNYALMAVGIATFLVSLAGFCGAKRESTCLLTVYSVFILLLIFLQISAIILINVKTDVIREVKDAIKEEAGKINVDTDNLKPGSKVMQTLFFGVSLALSTILFLITMVLCCRVRREERVKQYVNSVNA